MPRHLTGPELNQHLRDQLDFIDASCDAFDAGREIESKRLATHVRVLVHNTPASRSLLDHFGMQDKIRMWDGGTDLSSGFGATWVGPGLAYFSMGTHDVKVHPYCDIKPVTDGHLRTFDYWWTAGVVRPQTTPPISRKQITLWLANKDGGAHVDIPPATYRALTDGSALGFTFHVNGVEVPVSPVPAAMRQIAEEVRVSVRQQVGHLLA